jgi:hypothetical protein
MINEAISKSPVALLLGAGASKPFSKPLMAEFVRGLNDDVRYRSDKLFQAIVARQADLEFLFEELEEWKRKSYYAQPSNPLGRIGGVLGVEPTEGSDKLYVGRLVESAESLSRDIRRVVFSTYRDVGPASRIVELFRPLLAAVSEHLDFDGRALPTFTTNYDPAVEDFCKETVGEYPLFDGFVPQPYSATFMWRREAIDNFDPHLRPAPCIVLFKLHGSTNWFKRGKSFVKSDVAAYLDDDPNYQNLLIYPAQRKVAIEDPYSTGYEYFQRTLENAKLLIVVGYSFRDYDALSRLRLAASYNPGLRILVVDPNAASLCRMLKGRGVVASPIPENFGNPSASYLSRITEAVGQIAHR